MYSADVPAILSARKTYSFSGESNPAHARLPHAASLSTLPFSRRPHFPIREAPMTTTATSTATPAMRRREALFLHFSLSLPRGSSFVSFLACPASCSLILMLISFLLRVAFFQLPSRSSYLPASLFPFSFPFSFFLSFFTIFQYDSLAYMFFAFLQFRVLSLRLQSLFYIPFSKRFYAIIGCKTTKPLLILEGKQYSFMYFSNF